MFAFVKSMWSIVPLNCFTTCYVKVDVPYDIVYLDPTHIF